MRFYVHAFEDVPARFAWDYDRIFYHRWCEEALAALVRHPDRTENPASADFFVVSTTLRAVSFAGLDYQVLSEQIRGLDHASSGKKHVVFDFTDHPRPVLGGPDLIVCKSAFHERYYDRARCVSIPQFPRYRFDRPFAPASRRRFLAGFKGNPRPELGDLRTRLLGLHDGKRMALHGAVLGPEDLHIPETGPGYERVHPGQVSYTELLFDSAFALLPRAAGYALSYRMIECMNAGCVPVVISDGYVLPFSEILDYDRFAVRVPEARIGELRRLLERRLREVDRLQAEAVRVYGEYFSSTERIMHHALTLAGAVAARSRQG